jgi:hypothetical protein
MSHEPGTAIVVPETAESEETLSAVIDVLGDAVTAIPAPIRNNFFKAIGQLCTATVDVPVAMLEGVAAEKRAETKARVKLISTSAEQLATQMSINPEYVRAAAKKFTHKVVREQVNLDKVSEVAFVQLQSDKAPASDAQDGAAEAVPDISVDWLNAFEREASQMSTEGMQLLFGKILAGEIRKPSSFSIKTIKLMAELDGRGANLFRLLCSLSISLRVPKSNTVIDARVVSLGGNAGANSLQSYGLNFDNLNLLQEYGLVISDYNSYMDYRPAVAVENRVGLPLTYQKTIWALLPKVPVPAAQEFRVHGVALSRSGKELLPIVDVDPHEQYTAAIHAFIETQGYHLVSVKS